MENQSSFEVNPDYCKCPFYGFAYVNIESSGRFLVNSKGNQCALIKDISPCKMALANVNPDWDVCNFVEGKPSIEAMLASAVVFPTTDSKGVSFQDWKNYITRRNDL
jgi:hypothetical protein